MVHRHNSVFRPKKALFAALTVGALLAETIVFCSAQVVINDEVAIPSRPTKTIPHPDPPIANGDPSPATPDVNARYRSPEQIEADKAAVEESRQAHNLIQQALIDHDVGAIAWVSAVSLALISCIFMLIRQRIHDRWRRSLADQDTELKYDYLDKE